MSDSEVLWPAGHEPRGAALHARNEAVTAATPAAVWALLVRPDRWHEHYRNALRVSTVSGPWPELALGSTWRWVTFGAPVTTTVTEVEEGRRLAWTGRGLGAEGHHAWLLEPLPGGGCRIVTEETQRGPAPRLLRPVLLPAVRRAHQSWVDGLAQESVR